MSEGLEQFECPREGWENPEEEEPWGCCATLEMKFACRVGEPSVFLIHKCGRCSCCETKKCPNKMKKLYLASTKKQRRKK